MISAAPAPRARQQGLAYHRLPDDRLADVLRRFGGTFPSVLRDAELLGMFLPIVRADFEVVETYQYVVEPALNCPLTVFGGTDDRLVKVSALLAWRDETSADFRFQIVPGDHFFPTSAMATFLPALARELLVGGADDQLAYGARA